MVRLDEFTNWFKENVGLVVFLSLLLLVALATIASRSFRRNLVKISATVYLWVAFWGSHLVCFILQIICLVLVGWWVPRRVRKLILSQCQQVTIIPLINLNPFWWTRVVRYPKGGIPKGSIIMPNHLSYVDSWVIAASILPIAPLFVAMHALFKMPLFGQVMKLAGHIPVIFYKKDDGRWGVKNGEEIMQRATEEIKLGRRVCVFPEGSLAKNLELQEFKDGFFRLAKDIDAPIVPVAMWGNHNLFPPGTQFNMADYSKVKIAVGDPVYPADFESFEALRDHVRQTVLELRNALPNFDLYTSNDRRFTQGKRKSSAVRPASTMSAPGEDILDLDLEEGEEPTL